MHPHFQCPFASAQGPPSGVTASEPGTPNLGQPTPEERAALVAQLEERIAGLQTMITKAYCLCNLALRNMDAAAEHADKAGGVSLRLPFLLVQTGVDMAVRVHELDAPYNRTVHLDLIGCVVGRLVLGVSDCVTLSRRLFTSCTKTLIIPPLYAGHPRGSPFCCWTTRW